MPIWSSEQYNKFIKERTQPSIDLVEKINTENPKNIIDIGCGPGNSTKILSDRFPNAHIIGADNSSDMIENAKSSYPDCEFILFDANKDFDTMNRKYDIVFSNACIQWIPNHHVLLKNMIDVLNDGGTLAIQTPMNYHEPIHIIISELVNSKKWKDKIKKPRIFHNLTPSAYFDLLSEISTDFSMWETVYYHKMPSHTSIMDWYKGTGLRPYLAVLNKTDAADFESDVYNEVVKAYPKQSSGEIIFRFPRLFFTAIK